MQRRTVAIALVGALMASCSPTAPRLIVQLVTDYVPGRDFDEIAVSYDGVASTVVAARDRSYGRAVRVTDVPLPTGGRLSITLALLLRGTVVQTQPRVAQPVSGQATLLTFLVTRDCAGVSCPGASDRAAIACVGATCVNPECSPEHPELCPACGGGCPASAISCVENVCRPEGICFASANDSLCPTGSICIADRGCRDLSVDAGAEDAAPPSDGSSDSGRPPSPYNVAFLSREVAADFGGLAPADDVCAMDAVAAGLTGRFVALLHGAGASAFDRLGTSSGWVRPDGRVVSTSQAALRTDPLVHPVVLTADGMPAVGAFAWLGSSGGDCNGWTSIADNVNIGLVGSVWPRTWSGDSATTGCGNSGRLYCFQIDHGAGVLSPPTRTGRRIFISDVAAAGTAPDAACDASRAAAGLPETFRAFVAGIGTSALDGVMLDARPWTRMDGQELFADAASVMAGEPEVPVLLDARGVASDAVISVGAPGIATPGDAVTTCTGWTDPAGGDRYLGRGAHVGLDWFGGAHSTCSATYQFYCLED